MLHLTELLERKPKDLSGGQRQRVAIGRTLVKEPAVFLFDEPLSNLDAQLRSQMRIEIKRLHQRLGTTIVYVTHDQIEAMTMADRIVVMRDGLILQVGTPTELYESPVDVFTARFIGSPSMNLIEGSAKEGALTAGGVKVKGTLPQARSGKVLVGVRPHDLLVGEAPADTALAFDGKVTAVEPLGSETLVHLDIAGSSAIATAPGKLLPAVDSIVTAWAAPGSLYLFDAQSEKALGRL
jgi:multiple sugar transport system ATP-binding protein